MQELSQLIGKPLRLVCVEVPRDGVLLLMLIVGFESFSAVLELLEMDKLGFRFKDGQNMLASHADPRLNLAHSVAKRELCFTVSSDVDDMSLTGPRGVLDRVLRLLAEDFGELKIQWHAFESVGEKIEQGRQTFRLATHQIRSFEGTTRGTLAEG